MSEGEHPPANVEPVELRGEQVKREVQRQVLAEIKASFFQGPMPPPEMLEHYEHICPGFANRTLAMAEKQADNRRSLEQKVLDAKIRQESKGQMMAFILATLFLAVGAYAIHEHQVGVAVGFWSVDIVGILGMFVWRQRREIKQITQKSPPGGRPGTMPSPTEERGKARS